MLTHTRVDTNSLFLTEQLNDLGIEVTQKHVVGDDRERIAGLVKRAMSAVPFVVISGGLRYLREDDLTRDAVALALGQADAAEGVILIPSSSDFARWAGRCRRSTGGRRW